MPTLKADWAEGDDFTHEDANDVATEVNSKLSRTEAEAGYSSSEQTALLLADAVEQATDYADVRDRLLLPRRSKVTSKVKHVVPANKGGSGWTFASSGAGMNTTESSTDYTQDRHFGDRCMRVLTLGNGAQSTAYRSLPAIIDVSDCDIRITMKLADYNMKYLRIVIGNQSLTKFSQATIGLPSGSSGSASAVFQAGRWVQMDLPKSRFTGNAGTEVDWTQVQRVQVTFEDWAAGAGSGAADVRLHSFDFIQTDPFGKNPNGTVVITADDSHATHYSVLRPALAARGWKATLMPIIDAHGTNNAVFLTTAQVQEMHAEGHEIGAHCFASSTHSIGLPALTQQQRIDEFEAIRGWQDAYGFDSPTHSYPLGAHDAATEADVARYWSTSRISGSQLSANETINPGNRFALQAMNITQGAADIGARAVKAHSEKGLLIIMLHAIVESGGDANSVTSAQLTAVLNAIAASGCDVVTMAEATKRMRI